jgi:hypothetical protein
MIEFVFMWLPWRLPVPVGWIAVADQPLNHHHDYCRLVMLVNAA